MSATGSHACAEQKYFVKNNLAPLSHAAGEEAVFHQLTI